MKVCKELLWTAEGEYKKDAKVAGRDRNNSIGISKVIPFWKRIKQEYGLEPKPPEEDVHPAEQVEQDAGCVQNMPEAAPSLEKPDSGRKKADVVSPRHKRVNPKTGDIEVIDRVVVKNRRSKDGAPQEKSMCAQQ